MHDQRPVESSVTVETALPVAPSLDLTLEAENLPIRSSPVDGRVVFICVLAILLGVTASVVAQILVHLIALITNLSFFHRWSLEAPTFIGVKIPLWAIGIPVIGGIIVGIMARYGSSAIRGHGIPEAMEKVLLDESRIPPRLTFLKPLSAAIAIGTGGPFGAEGPIIATGGALGSLVGQVLKTTATERKTLLACGAAAGMAATFGTPVSAVLLAVELLLFEFRPRSLVPVALASCAAAGARIVFDGAAPIFAMPALDHPAGAALWLYILLGAIIGVMAVVVTKMVYWVEDSFEHIPLHWMWWPAIGAIAVGVVGYFEPRTLGVGYYNISGFLKADMAVDAVAALFILKFISWVISLGSGTSGGTLAPLFTIGGGMGLCIGSIFQHLFPSAGVDLRVAALVGMAAMFAGASRALLASAVFAFETTMQPLGLLPLLGGCSASFLISALLMPTTIMTEKIARRGVRVPSEYAADSMDQVFIREVAAKDLVTILANRTIADVREWIGRHQPGSHHQGYPIVDGTGSLLGIVTRRQFLDPAVDGRLPISSLLQGAAVTIDEDSTLLDAADKMVLHNVGRLAVLSPKTHQLVGIVTRSDLLKAHRRRLVHDNAAKQTFRFGLEKLPTVAAVSDRRI
jgi:H+/Cl- antiporter ClcA/CBS domain-containing protein